GEQLQARIDGSPQRDPALRTSLVCWWEEVGDHLEGVGLLGSPAAQLSFGLERSRNFS
ncbi:unnamed protein product, partial [Rangifer tarandus platyrhynchus]